jgi:multiple sugar transport system substrate-binding protein
MKKLVFVLVALVTILSVVSCAPQAAATEAPAVPAAPAAPAATTAPAAAEPVTIHVITMDQAAMKTTEIDQVARDFEALNPGIKVVMEYVGYDSLHDKITTGMASTPPAYDAIMVDVIWPDEFIQKGYLLDVSDRVTQEMKDGIFPAAWNGVTRNGKVYGMPWLMDTKYFMYNKDMLAKAGFNAPPKTWEELVEQAKVLKEKGIAEFPITWSWNQKEGVVCDYTALLFGNGGAFLDKDGKPAFNDAKGVAVLDWMKKTIGDGLTNPNAVASDEMAVEADFLAGKSAFALNWLFQYSDSLDPTKSKVANQIAFAPMPVFKAGADAGIQSSTVDGSSAFSVIATSPNADAAWKFLTYLSSNEVQTKYSAEQLPIWKADYEGQSLETLLAATPSNPVTVPAFLAQFPYANERPTVPYYNEASAALQQAIQEALTGVKPAQQAMDEAAAKWVDLAKQ